MPDSSTDAQTESRRRLQARWDALSPEEQEKIIASLNSLLYRAVEASFLPAGEARKDPKFEASAEDIAEVALRARDHQNSLLRRLDVEPSDVFEDFWLKLWAACRHVGISQEEFYNLTPREISAVLEARVGELEVGARASRGDRGGGTGSAQPPKSQMSVNLRGRPKGMLVDGKRLREYRGALTQEEFADRCVVSVDTIQRGEAGKRWSEEIFNKVAQALTRLIGTQVTADDLKNLKK